ncbi:MAG: tetratricopeptide repeat protein [Syntrophales bacterium]
MSEVIRREDTAIIFKRLDECRRHLQKGNIFSCLISFRDALKKMKATRMLPADEKELNKIINEFQEQLAYSKTFRDVYGPVTFRDNDIDTALDFMNQLIMIKEEEINQSLAETETEEEMLAKKFATLQEKLEKIKMLISIGDHALAQGLIGEDDEIISQLIDFYNTEGITHRRNRDSERALQEFRKALVVYQQDEGIFYNLARVHVERLEWKCADEAIRSALNINPEFAEGKTLLAHIQKHLAPEPLGAVSTGKTP